jgi:hypothetical protein
MADSTCLKLTPPPWDTGLVSIAAVKAPLREKKRQRVSKLLDSGIIPAVFGKWREPAHQEDEERVTDRSDLRSFRWHRSSSGR